ncbi:GPI-anchored protein PB15E9.01c, partial [Biomphalaria glabrata]
NPKDEFNCWTLSSTTLYTSSYTQTESIPSVTTLTSDVSASSSVKETNTITDIPNSAMTFTPHAVSSNMIPTNAVTDFTTSIIASLPVNSIIKLTNVVTDITGSVTTPTYTFLDTVTLITSQTATSNMTTYIETSVMTSSITVATLEFTPTVSDITFSATASMTQNAYISQTTTAATPVVINDTELTTINKTLKCPCNCLNKLVELMKQNVSLSIALQIELVQKLLLKRSSLSSYRREKTSTENIDESEKYIGSTFGVITVCIVIVVIVLCDLVIFTKFLCPYLSIICSDRR